MSAKRTEGHKETSWKTLVYQRSGVTNKNWPVENVPNFLIHTSKYHLS